MKKIVLAGGTGYLGQLLKAALVKRGDKVVILTRGEKQSHHPLIQYVQWDARQLGEWVSHLEHADVLINLCGESVARRFTAANKTLLRASRVVPTQILGEAISTLQNPPKHWINLSGISIFEDVEGCHDENSQSVGGGFLAELTKEWEGVFLAIDTLGTKKTILRVSPVLARRSGMFAELYPLVKLGLGGTVGSGQQYISWIHEQDFVRLTLWLIGLSIPRSIYHACSPFPVTNAMFMEKLRRAVGISYGLPLPTPLAKVGSFFKGVDSSMLLGSVAATTRVTVEDGFNFDFPYISDAFSALIQST